MSQDHSIDPSLRRVTKSEACQLLNVSLSTLNRRIAEGQLEVERVQQGQIHRVFVLLPADTDRPEAPEEAEPDGGTDLAEAAEEKAEAAHNGMCIHHLPDTEWLRAFTHVTTGSACVSVSQASRPGNIPGRALARP